MPTFATAAEIIDAFEAMSPLDKLKLEAHARSLIRAQKLCPIQEPAELIHEALYRALDGRRRWPTHVLFKAFMVETMRSVANHDTDKMDDKPGAHVPFDAVVVEAQQWSMGLSSRSAEDDYAASERRLARIAALDAADRALEADGDELARHVLRGMVEELSQSELCERTNAAPNQMDAARKRAQRRLRDAYEKSGAALH